MTRLASEVLGQGPRSFRKHRVLTPHSLNPTLRSHTHGLCALPRPLPWCLKWVLISTVPGHLWSSVSRYRTMIFFSCQGDRWFQSPGPCLPRVCATHSHPRVSAPSSPAPGHVESPCPSKGSVTNLNPLYSKMHPDVTPLGGVGRKQCNGGRDLGFNAGVQLWPELFISRRLRLSDCM